MKYEGVITDVNGTWHRHDVSAGTRWDALQKLLDFARRENIMPEGLDVVVPSGSKEKPR